MLYTNVTIESMGYELAPNVITSTAIEKRLAPVWEALHLQRGQLEALTGIIERRQWDRDYPMHEGATAAARKALSASDVDPRDIGMLVYGGVCRDHLEPATACAVAHALDLPPETQIYDLSNACLGVINGMVQVANAIELGHIRAGLVVSCESSRQIMDLTMEKMLADPDMEMFRKTVATLTGGSGAVAVLLAETGLAAGGHRLVGGAIRNASRHHRLCTWGRTRGFLPVPPTAWPPIQWGCCKTVSGWASTPMRNSDQSWAWPPISRTR
jgi:3-oxoacyl-[acyl-carrier-protein] synthase III